MAYTWRSWHFNPRSLAGATRYLTRRSLSASRISIHAPSRERPWRGRFPRPHRNFNPRSLAGATKGWVYRTRVEAISIHAPSRERLMSFFMSFFYYQFQSTLPRGSDGTKGFDFIDGLDISIHAPSRERLVISKHYKACFVISIHAPSRERPPQASSANA